MITKLLLTSLITLAFVLLNIPIPIILLGIEDFGAFELSLSCITVFWFGATYTTTVWALCEVWK